MSPDLGQADDQPSEGDPSFYQQGYEEGLIERAGGIFFPRRTPIHSPFDGSRESFDEYLRGYTDGWIERTDVSKRQRADGNGDH